MRRAGALAFVLATTVTCKTSPTSSTSAASSGCPDFALAADGTCAGVPPEACVDGFVPDGERGCTAVLPADACPDGTVAWLGETTCHEVAPCGDGKWGDIPVEADTEYVDGSYAGGDSDGSADRPWTFIAYGLLHAAPGAIVAVAAGSYQENVSIKTKPIRLWGVCPGAVTIDGGAYTAVDLYVTNAELHGVTVTGAQGIDVSGMSHALIEGVRVRDTSDIGILVSDQRTAATDVVVRGSLVERAGTVGVLFQGADGAIERVVARATRLGVVGDGDGVDVAAGAVSRRTATVTLTDVVAEKNERGGYLLAGVVTASGLVARENMKNGIAIGPTSVTLDRCVAERNTGGGITMVGGATSIDGCTVRDTQANGAGVGTGLQVQRSTTPPAAATLTLRRSSLAFAVGNGIIGLGADLTMDAVVVRGTLDGIDGFANGVASLPSGIASSLDATGCAISDVGVDGIFVVGGTARVAATRIHGVRPDAIRGSLGDGLTFENATGTIDGCAVDAVARAGVSNFGAEVHVTATTFASNAIDLDVETDPSNAHAAGHFIDDGANVCRSQGSDGTCAVQSSGLAPPTGMDIGDAGAP